MRFLRSLPALAFVIAFYVLFTLLSGGMMDAESLLFSFILPSESEIFFKLGDMFVLAGLAALFLEVLKAARPGRGSIIDHMMSTATFIVGLVLFLLLPGCATVSFFFLVFMSLIDVVAGFAVSLMAARRDYSVSSEADLT